MAPKMTKGYDFEMNASLGTRRRATNVEDVARRRKHLSGARRSRLSCEGVPVSRSVTEPHPDEVDIRDLVDRDSEPLGQPLQEGGREVEILLTFVRDVLGRGKLRSCGYVLRESDDRHDPHLERRSLRASDGRSRWCW